jgi:hypothetical protein
VQNNKGKKALLALNANKMMKVWLGHRDGENQ